MLNNILKQKLADDNFQREFEAEILEHIQAKQNMKDSAFFSNKESLDHLQEQMVYQKLSETVRQTYLS